MASVALLLARIEDEMNQQTVKIVVFDQPVTLDPHAAYDSSSRHVTANVYDNLLHYTDGTEELRPSLLCKLPTVTELQDNVKVSLSIRQNVTFHDGRLLSTEDVVYSIRRLLSTSREVASLWLEAFSNTIDILELPVIKNACESIRIERDNSITITFPRRFEPFNYLLANWSPIVSKSWAMEQGAWNGELSELEKYAFKEEYQLAETNGTGPYKLQSKNEAMISFRKHYLYYGTQPYAEEIRLISENDSSERECLLQSGEADFSVCPREAIPRLAEDPNIFVTEAKDEWHVNPIGFFTYQIKPGCEALGSGKFSRDGIHPKALADYDLRRALVLSFDYNAFISSALNGQAIAHYGPFPRPAFEDGPEPEYKYDLDEAYYCLKKACDGEAIRKGFRLVTYTHDGNYARTLAAQNLAEHFNTLSSNCVIEVKKLPLGLLLRKLYGGECPLAWIGWDADYPHPHIMASRLLSKYSWLGAQIGFDFPEIEEKVILASQVSDREKSTQIYREVARLSIEALTHFFLPGKISYLSYRKVWENVHFMRGVSNVLDFTTFDAKLVDSSS